MRIGIFAVGLVLLILGAIGFLWAEDITSRYETPVGEIARGLSEEEEERYRLWGRIKYSSIVLGVIGFVMTVFGGLSESKGEMGRKREDVGREEKVRREEYTGEKEGGEMYCKHCGEKVSKDADYCPSCGKEL